MTSISIQMILQQESPKNQWDHFELGAKLVLARWTALRMAMEGGWGGGDIDRKYEIFVDEVLNLFKHHRNIYVDNLAGNIEEYIESEFSLVCEDGSVDEVSRILVALAEDCKKGIYTNVLQWKEEVLTSKLVNIDLKKAKLDTSGMTSSTDLSTQNMNGEDNHQEPEEENVVDEDGFMTVRKSSRRKNQPKYYNPAVAFPGAM